MSQLRQQLPVVILVAVIAEVVLLRFGPRLGPVVPVGVNVLPVFAVVEWAGVLALNVGVLAGCTLLLLTAAAALRRGPAGGLLAAALAAAVLVNLGLAALVPALSDGMAGQLHTATTGSAVILLLLTSTGPVRLRAALVLLGLAQLLALGLGPAALAEVGAVAAAVALPWLIQVRPARRDILIGVAAGLGVAVAATVQPWGVATVAIWTMAFSLFLPPILYGAALASIIVTALALRRAPEDATLLVGLTLIWLAGLKLDVSAYALMSLAGLAVATRAHLTAPAEVAATASPPGGHALAIRGRSA
jgi:hypothetical protein